MKVEQYTRSRVESLRHRCRQPPICSLLVLSPLRRSSSSMSLDYSFSTVVLLLYVATKAPTLDSVVFRPVASTLAIVNAARKHGLKHRSRQGDVVDKVLKCRPRA